MESISLIVYSIGTILGFIGLGIVVIGMIYFLIITFSIDPMSFILAFILGVWTIVYPVFHIFFMLHTYPEKYSPFFTINAVGMLIGLVGLGLMRVSGYTP